MSTASQAQQPRRARDLGIVPGVLPTGAHNAITDVAGVHVGHATVAQGDDIRTGVTAVLPTQLIERRALPANLCVGNGYGKL
ncbi:MAG: P1 family peptidase, partial [Micromonosporaceae bacterium]